MIGLGKLTYNMSLLCCGSLRCLHSTLRSILDKHYPTCQAWNSLERVQTETRSRDATSMASQSGCVIVCFEGYMLGWPKGKPKETPQF